MTFGRKLRRLRKRISERKRKQNKVLFEPLEPRLLLDAVTIESQVASAITDGLIALRDFGQNLEDYGNLGRDIPIVNQALGSALDISAIIENELLDPATSYLGTGDPDSNGLANELDSRDSLDVIDGSDTSTDPDTLVFDVLLNKTFLTNFQLDLGQPGLDADLFVENPPTLELSAELTFDFLFGVDLTDDTFFIDVKGFSVDGKVSEALDFGLDVGFLEAQVVDGALELTAALKVEFNDPDDTDAGITRTELESTPVEELASLTTVSTSLQASLPVEASFLGLGVSPTIMVTGSEAFFGEAPNLTLQDFDALQTLDEALAQGFEALAGFGDNLDLSAQLGTELPFLNTSIGSVADLGGLFAEALREPLNNVLNSEGPRSADTLDGAIAEALADLGAAGISVQHTLVDDVLSFEVVFETERSAGVSLGFASGDAEAGDQQGDLATEMAELGLALDGEFALDLVVDVGFDMTFGVDLTELPGVGDAFFLTLGEPTIQARLEGSGELSGNLGLLDVSAELIETNLAAGITVALLGPNGDGRTTLNELQGVTAAELVDITANGSVEVVLGLSADLAGLSIAEPRVVFADSDLFDEKLP
ncbi:MAG: LEPR-XLL domain-containing protein, partial [Deltaproteobacteria bacterium]|nr:LEPR-XLL domain-containing protein [Deltaproteobacteria bacterium]